MRWLVRLAIGCVIGLIAQPVPAAQTLKAAAIVNDEVITQLDLEARIRLVTVSSDLDGTPETMRRLAPQILRNLINERLQLQEARRLGIEVKESEIRKATARLAQRNNMSRQQFLRALENNGIMTSTLTARVRANIAWQKVIAREIRPRVNVGSAQVAEVVARRKAQAGQRLLRLREIYLPAEDGSTADVRETAERLLGELRNGARFGALARQFSQAATAATGGDLGWITAASLPEAVAEVAADMQTGRVAGPIQARNGFYILGLQDARRQTAGATTLTLKQVMIPLPEDADAGTEQALRDRLGRVRETVDGCESVSKVAEGVDKAQVIELGTMKLGDMPDRVRDKVGQLEVGGVSAPLKAGGGLGVVVVCDRETAGLDREKIRRNLVRSRMQMLAQRYLRDLRRQAHIERRMDVKTDG
jgi:peptidyl-prolyl cis-trans isomerase SurA